MDFSESKAIYQQIADYVCEQVLMGRWKENDRILSVRELGVQLEVNPNTVLRAYDFLQRFGIISNRRGIGYFASEDAIAKIKELRRERFVNRELPRIFQEMELLGMDISELKEYYDGFLKAKKNEKDN
ncbi:MAG: GntR family transcriptional regulator [Bacteroidales bacterium]|nr:GntR family transcriptional regulator [Bacteroidales bacterium]